MNNIGQNFINYYYDTMTNQGINKLYDLFDKDVICSINNNEFIGAYNWLIHMVKDGIYKFEYNNLSKVVQEINNSSLIIIVNGHLKPIGYWNQFNNNWIPFIETFVLQQNINNNYFIKNYIIKCN